ncbi:MAG: YtxH domain-containing protein [Tissierellia bacterium]|nr:YtxH domain-containing protein [Tissierellia bacterium]
MKLADIIKERKRAERRRQKVDTAKKIAIGSAIGALAGLLFAPKSGKETRQDIVDKTKKAAESTTKTLKNLEEKVKDEVKSKVEDIKERKMFEIDLNKDDDQDEEIEKDEVAGE